MFAFIIGAILAAFISVPSLAQTGIPTTAPVISAIDAVNIAKDGVGPSLHDHIVSVYGVGTPVAIQTWWIIFCDPSVPSHGRVVKVDNGQITRTAS